MKTFGLTMVFKTTWQQVHDDWERREAGYWDAYFHGRGYDSWVVWRDKYVKPYKLAGREWTYYQIDAPEKTIPNMWAGSFGGWKHYYPEGVRAIQFKDLVENPAVAKNEKVQAVMQDFPSPTTMIGLTDGEKLVLFEGMHRATAVALAEKEGKLIAGKAFIALTEFAPDEAELFKQTYTQK